jgi:hypothetical protein
VPAIGLRLDLILPCESNAGKKGICEVELDVIIWDTRGSGECGWMVHTQMFSGTHPKNNIFTSSFGVFIDPKGLGSLGAAIKAPCTKQTEEFWFMCAHPTNQRSLVFTLVPRQQFCHEPLFNFPVLRYLKLSVRGFRTAIITAHNSFIECHAFCVRLFSVS